MPPDDLAVVLETASGQPVEDVTEFCEAIGIQLESNFWEGSLISGIYYFGWVDIGAEQQVQAHAHRLLDELRSTHERKRVEEEERKAQAVKATLQKEEEPEAKMGGVLTVRRLGPEERIFGGKGILMRYQLPSTSASSEKSDTPNGGSSNSATPPPSASDPMQPAINGLGAALQRKYDQVMAQPARAQSQAPGSTTAKPNGKP